MCVEIAFDRMKIPEARKALVELVGTTEDSEQQKHYKQLSDANDEELLRIAKDHKTD
jgi:hypothetical protein